MTELTFTIPGIDGEFTADLDELLSYKTNKQFAKSETEPGGMFEAFERVFAGRDEEYMERLGGSVESTGTLMQAAFEAAKAKLLWFVLELEGHRAEVVADFRQYYGIDLPLEGGPDDLRRAALLWEQLPKESRRAPHVPGAQMERGDVHALAHRASAQEPRVGAERQEAPAAAGTAAAQDARAARGAQEAPAQRPREQGGNRRDSRIRRTGWRLA